MHGHSMEPFDVLSSAMRPETALETMDSLFPRARNEVKEAPVLPSLYFSESSDANGAALASSSEPDAGGGRRPAERPKVRESTVVKLHAALRECLNMAYDAHDAGDYSKATVEYEAVQSFADSVLRVQSSSTAARARAALQVLRAEMLLRHGGMHSKASEQTIRSLFEAAVDDSAASSCLLLELVARRGLSSLLSKTRGTATANAAHAHLLRTAEIEQELGLSGSWSG